MFVFLIFRFRACLDVQWRVCAWESSPGRRLQTASEQGQRHLRQPQQEAEANAEENGHRYGEISKTWSNLAFTTIKVTQSV